MRNAFALSTVQFIYHLTNAVVELSKILVWYRSKDDLYFNFSSKNYATLKEDVKD